MTAEKLLQFCSVNDLELMNTFLEKRKTQNDCYRLSPLLHAQTPRGELMLLEPTY